MKTYLSPAPDWQWRFDPEQEQLILYTAQQGAFVTAFKNKQLLLNRAMQEPFTVEHSEAFYQFSDVLQRGFLECAKSVPDAMLWHICIHAVAACFYHKAVVNKSYWFTKNEAKPVFAAEDHGASNAHGARANIISAPMSQLVVFDTQYSAASSVIETGCGLLLQTDGGFATLLLLSPQLTVLEHKTLLRYTVLNTHVNTLREATLEERSVIF